LDKTSRYAYVYGIDAIRFIAAMFVAVFHLTSRQPDGFWMMPAGWIGVQIFFVISGVVIANSATGVTPRSFAVSRVLRLYPAAWIAAAVNGVLLLVIARQAYRALGLTVVPQLGAFARSLTLFGDYFMTSAYWTLPIEISFYGLIFVSLLIGGDPRLRLVARCLVAISVPYILALFLHTLRLIDAPWLDLGNGLKNALLVRHGPYFALGVYIWLKKAGYKLGGIDIVAITAALMSAGLEIFVRSSQVAADSLHGVHDAVTLPFMATTAGALFALFTCAIYVSVRYSERLVPPAASRTLLRTAGLMTYPFYLLHETVGGAILFGLANVNVSFGCKAMIAVAGAAFVAFIVATWAEPAVWAKLKGIFARFFGPRGSPEKIA
jgi:exopolysaccharide production protein ExoZ